MNASAPRPASQPVGAAEARAAPNASKRTIALLRALAPDEGYNLTALPSVRVLRSNRPLRARRCSTIRAS
jgi:hypothetical protein